MSPTIIYISLVVMGVLIGIAALVFHKEPQRECPQCGERVPITRRKCRTCQFEFT